MIQSVRIIRLHGEGTCNLGVEGQEGGRLRRKGIFREGTAWAKGKQTQEHTQRITEGSSNPETQRAREDEAGEGGRSHRGLSATQKTLNFIPVSGVVGGGTGRC